MQYVETARGKAGLSGPGRAPMHEHVFADAPEARAASAAARLNEQHGAGRASEDRALY